MGLFGALFAGVSGLDSQSNKIGVISNNISNVNTVGYKQGQSTFDTLVVPSGTTSFSPGGAIGGNQQLVNQQGTISASTSPTDVAISGNGFFVVSQTPAGVSGGSTPLYTRAGSFNQDDEGNFVNSDGYYLQGLPIQPNGQPAEANTQNLATVKISQSATGSPTATSTVAIQANLNAQQAVLPGSSVTASMNTTFGTSSANAEPPASQIIIPNTGGSNLTVGNSFTITSSTSSGSIVKQDVFVYGGFATGRDINVNSNDNTVAADNGTGGQELDTETGVSMAVAANGHISLTVGDANNATDYAVGQNVSLSGITNANGTGLALNQINNEWQVVSNTGGTIVLSSAAVTSATAGSLTGTVSNRTAGFSGNILNATSTDDDFLTTTNNGSAAMSASDFAPSSLDFTITVSGNTPETFTYNSNPDPSSGTFNSLSTLAQAINDTTNLTANISGGQIYISADNPNDQVTFANGNAGGTPNTSPPLPGIDWLQELGLPSSLAANTSSSSQVFNSLQSLATAINTLDPTNLTATVTNPNAASMLSITEANPEQTISFSDGNLITNATNANNGSVLQELGIQGLNLANSPPYTIAKGVTYDPTNPNLNMSSGAVTPQFSKDITVYDSQGFSHTLALNYVKISTNEWAMEVTAVPAKDVSEANGQLAFGNVKFNADGSLGQVDASNGGGQNIGDLASPITINWTNGAGQSQIALDLGELPASTTDGASVTQTAGPSTVSQATQNGAPTGELTGVTIDQNGFVIAAFSNGQTQKLYQIPLAVVNNADGMEAVSGNAYQETLASGDPTLDFANEGGAGEFTPSALEQSNVDLSTQLTDLIVAQQAYGANSKLLTVADSLLQELDQIIQ